MSDIRSTEDDALPWLEPYRDARSGSRPLPNRGTRRPLAFGAGIGLLLAVGAGGYWLGQRDDAAAPPPQSATIVLPAPKPAAPPVRVAEASPPAAESAIAEAQPPAAKKVVPVRKKSAARKRAPTKKIRTAGVETKHLDEVRAAQERKPDPAPPPKPVSRPWPKMPSPGPAGQVIQLGAFTTVARAGNAYQSRVARYPMLARMPRVIVPVATKPTGRVLYVLRLGTTSRQQSKTVCRKLRRRGDHCLVIG